MIYTPQAKCIPDSGFFLPYQWKWIYDRSRIKVMEKSRQIGMSWTTAYRNVRETSKKGLRYDTWVSSRDSIQSGIYLHDCISFADLYKVACEDLGERIYKDEKGNPYTSHEIRFANGRSVHSMSSNPNAQAGKRGSRVLDEFALHDDPRSLYAIAYPGITWGGQLEIISTHRGSANYFNIIVLEANGKNPKNISIHRITLQDALEQGFLHKLQGKLVEGVEDENDPILEDERLQMDEAEYFDFIRNGCPDEETFQQEYMCNPSDDASAFLDYNDIDGCCYLTGIKWETDLRSCTNPLYIGVDVGREHDLTVIWVLECVNGMNFTRKIKTMQGVRFAEQEFVLWNLLRLPMVHRCCIDSTGLGRQFAERAKDNFGYKVEPVNFTSQTKEQLAYPLKAAFEESNVRIPRDDIITADLRAVKKTTTTSGNTRFAADRGKNGHADRFWALALAIHAGSSGTLYVPKRHTTDRNSRRYSRKERACV